jgi:hypothetical protein
MMNRAQTALAGVTLVVGGIVYGVHWDQERNKKEMRAGVLRDMERIKLKKVAAAAAAAAASNEK